MAASNASDITWSVLGSGGGAAACFEGAGGTVVDLGADLNRTTPTQLTAGGNTRYDGTGILTFVEWLGIQGTCGLNRHKVSMTFPFELLADHSGGCASGLSFFSNVTRYEDYDVDGDPGAFRLYPCNHGQGFTIRNPQVVSDFLLENYRAHGGWDSVRMIGSSSKELTVRGAWITENRDDCFENDSNQTLTVEDCLIGDTIGQHNGTFVFYSATSTQGSPTNQVTIQNTLVHNSLQRATSAGRHHQISFEGISDFICGAFFKQNHLNDLARLHLVDNVFMIDHLQGSGSSDGDPFSSIRRADTNLVESSGNLFIWRDLANIGTYPFALPPGFTLLNRAEGEIEWNSRAAQFKAEHPGVRRLNQTGIQRIFGNNSTGGSFPTFDVVDQD